MHMAAALSCPRTTVAAATATHAPTIHKGDCTASLGAKLRITLEKGGATANDAFEMVHEGDFGATLRITLEEGGATAKLHVWDAFEMTVVAARTAVAARTVDENGPTRKHERTRRIL